VVATAGAGKTTAVVQATRGMRLPVAWLGVDTSETSAGRLLTYPPAWKTIPSWYLLGREDRAVPPATQRFMARRAGSRITRIHSSHASLVSHPRAVTKLILKAVRRAGAARG
jgi:pimeloyl-ACP methyl ester carboxylesterase